ncbi:MAG: site-specific integrase [Alphaproteobacteria bacterium]|nr:site-specific integrase [Alphaproteobacteria bacterium]
MNDVKRPNNLHQIGTRYYFRAKVPVDLVSAYDGSREYKEALGTSDFKEACRLVSIAKVKFDQRNEGMRAALSGKSPPLSPEDMHLLACGWLAEQRRANIDVLSQRKGPLSVEDVAEALESLKIDEAITRDELARDDIAPAMHAVRSWFQRKGINVEQDSPHYRMLGRLMLAARLEGILRSKNRLKGQVVNMAFDATFDAVGEPFSGKTSANFNQDAVVAPERPFIKPVSKGPSLDEIVHTYLERPNLGSLSQKSQAKEKASLHLLIEILGKDRPITSVTADDLIRVQKTVARLPANFSKLYKGLSPTQMAEKAVKEGRATLKPETQTSYLARFKRLFDFAERANYIERNPARIIELPKDVVRAEDKRHPFTIEQLGRLFSSPLYTGCVDDERGAHRPGKAITRRGRFWVPLIALWTGLRLNECCQLTVADVIQAKGVWGILVQDDETQGQRIKTQSARRFVPIHPELERLGFVAYAEGRRTSGSVRLFPELLPDGTGYFSGPFSKWFARYLDRIGIISTKITFHSFRHSFADALRQADISPERQDMLGGWKRITSTRGVYGSGLRAELYGDICKISYPGLNLSHLYEDQKS